MVTQVTLDYGPVKWNTYSKTTRIMFVNSFLRCLQ